LSSAGARPGAQAAVPAVCCALAVPAGLLRARRPRRPHCFREHVACEQLIRGSTWLAQLRPCAAHPLP
jgi:hypothetical protein